MYNRKELRGRMKKECDHLSATKTDSRPLSKSIIGPSRKNHPLVKTVIDPLRWLNL